jgi:3-oxoacyl-[acyl-carrier-protein] synthase-3
VPHQANLRIIRAAARSLDLNEDRIFVNLERYGNTSSASIPIAVCEAVECGRVQPGDKLVLVGFGAGLTWAAAVIEWGVPEPLRKRNIIERTIRIVIYPVAAIRSRAAKLLRRIEAWLFGSPSPKRVDKDGKKK